MTAVMQTIDGTVHGFPRLTAAEIIELQTRVFESGRAKILKDLADAGALPDTKAKALSEYRRCEGTNELLREYVLTLVWQQEIIKISAVRGGIPTSALNDLGRKDALLLAGQLVGYEPVPESELPITPPTDDDGFVRRPTQGQPIPNESG